MESRGKHHSCTYKLNHNLALYRCQDYVRVDREHGSIYFCEHTDSLSGLAVSGNFSVIFRSSEERSNQVKEEGFKMFITCIKDSPGIYQNIGFVWNIIIVLNRYF